MIRPTMSHALDKDDLYRLMSEYASYLEEQLAKANERVEGILVGDMTPEDYYKISSSKFAIEKKIECLDDLDDFLLNEHDFKEDFSFGRVGQAISIFREQLRKEQE